MLTFCFYQRIYIFFQSSFYALDIRFQIPFTYVKDPRSRTGLFVAISLIFVFKIAFVKQLLIKKTYAFLCAFEHKNIKLQKHCTSWEPWLRSMRSRTTYYLHCYGQVFKCIEVARFSSGVIETDSQKGIFVQKVFKICDCYLPERGNSTMS